MSAIDTAGTKGAESELPPLAKPDTLSERTTDVLRQRILDGEFGLGERLVEAKIARQLQISRGPVREALKHLRAEGLVHEESRRGCFVVDLDETDIREIYDLRAAIEGYAARLIATRRDEEAIASLRRVLEELHRLASSDARDAFARRDLAFHEHLCELSGNRRLLRVFISNASILGLLLRIENKNRVQEPALDAYREHEELLTEIASFEPERAQRACAVHLERARDRLLESGVGATRRGY
jgi:GntR family transcriptional regulator, gluconate operon transcriptional repressor